MSTDGALPLVVVPYSDGHLNPWTRRVLDSYAINVSYSLLPDDDAYRRLLRDLWQAQRTVVLVEQDIVPWYGAIEELYRCMGEWCSCAYRYRGGYGIYHGLGCTKVSAELMQATPGLWDAPGHWSEMDRRLYFAAREVGQEPHPHRPPVLHLKEEEYTITEINNR